MYMRACVYVCTRAHEVPRARDARFDEYLQCRDVDYVSSIETNARATLVPSLSLSRSAHESPLLTTKATTANRHGEGGDPRVYTRVPTPPIPWQSVAEAKSRRRDKERTFIVSRLQEKSPGLDGLSLSSSSLPTPKARNTKTRQSERGTGFLDPSIDLRAHT